MSKARLYSVTTILKGLGPSDGLVYWNAKTPVQWILDHPAAWVALAKEDPEAAIKTALDARWAKSGKAAARGTDVHTAAEQLAYGNEVEISDELMPYVEQYQRFLSEFSPRFLMAEAPVYNPTWTYAGTLDAIVEIGGRRLVLDMKTTDKDPDARSRPPYPEIALQLTAYRRAEVVGVGEAERREDARKRYYVFDDSLPHEPMPETDGAVALVVSPYDYRLVTVRTDETIWRAFLDVREAFRWKVHTSGTALGPTLVPTREEVAS